MDGPWEIEYPQRGLPIGKLAALLEARNRNIRKARSLAHGTPLHIVRGEMQYLHASDGTHYLDLVNNVITIKPPMVLNEDVVDDTLSNLIWSYLKINITTLIQVCLVESDNGTRRTTICNTRAQPPTNGNDGLHGCSYQCLQE